MKSETFQKKVEDEQTEGWSIAEEGDEKVVRDDALENV